MAATHQVVLDWTDSADASAQYNIYRSGSVGTLGTLLNAAPLVAGVTTYTDTTVTPGIWYYSAEAVENGIASGPSNQVTVSLPPAAPTGLTVASFS